MKKVLFGILTILLAGCSSNKIDNSLLELVENRAQSDTTLVFQGFVIGTPIDSAKVDSMSQSMPIVIVTSNNDKFEFDHFAAEGNRDGISTENYEVISVSNDRINDIDFISLVRLYMESYGEPSYFSIIQNHIERIGHHTIGKIYEPSKVSFDAQSAINMILEDHEEKHEFLFVWEWKNQSIYLRHTRKLSILPFTTISYWNTGAADRKAKEAKEKGSEDAKKAAEQKELEESRAKQQI